MAHDPNVLIHDITKPFPLPDNCVDEILSVHVIEHISRQYILPMYQEFYRILRPGGAAATEWPDLLKMCQEIVNNPDCFWSHDKRLHKRTVAGIYGDSVRYPDPTMLHKWDIAVKACQEYSEMLALQEYRSRGIFMLNPASTAE
jgi:SAM-dependent methyltransferase